MLMHFAASPAAGHVIADQVIANQLADDLIAEKRLRTLGLGSRSCGQKGWI